MFGVRMTITGAPAWFVENGFSMLARGRDAG